MYTKLQFAKDLKIRIFKKQSTIDIGIWAYSVYLNWPDCKDDNFLDLLLDLSRMELGAEFKFTYEELKQIADDIIAGKDVIL